MLQLKNFVEEAFKASEENPILIDKFINHAMEIWEISASYLIIVTKNRRRSIGGHDSPSAHELSNKLSPKCVLIWMEFRSKVERDREEIVTAGLWEKNASDRAETSLHDILSAGTGAREQNRCTGNLDNACLVAMIKIRLLFEVRSFSIYGNLNQTKLSTAFQLSATVQRGKLRKISQPSSMQ